MASTSRSIPVGRLAQVAFEVVILFAKEYPSEMNNSVTGSMVKG